MVRISLTGIILKGRYCILEQIGQGGEGSLYLARDLELGTMWAVKELPISKKREAGLLRLLEHPALPRMMDYAEKDEHCYIIMEYIKGRSLEEELKEKKSLALKEIIETGISLCSVLEYLHTRRPPVYYGDLKPANIMRSVEGRLYLVDFGSAVFGYGGRRQVCLGTKGYAAPEQYEGEIGPESDVYALGKTLRVLCGNKIWYYMLQDPGFFLLLMKCGRTTRGLRYQSTAQVKNALEKLKKRKKHSLVLCTALLGFLLGTGLFVYMRPERREQPSFEEMLSQVTELYYEEQFLSGTAEERKQICSRAETGLQEILDFYKEPEIQRKVLLLLALNSELWERDDLAAFYYEQICARYPDCREAYGEYGIFLSRTGNVEKNRELYYEYGEKEKDGVFTGTETRNIRLWLEYMNKEREKDEKKKKQ